MSIKKRITITLPDKPYDSATSEGNTVDGWYNGPRYMTVSVVTATGQYYAVEQMGETLEETDPALQQHDGHTFLRIDAAADPLLASLLWPAGFSNPDIPDYEEEVAPADGDLPAVVYSHSYSNNVLSSLYAGLPTWNGSEWVLPPRYTRAHEDPSAIIDSIERTAAELTAAREVNDFEDEEDALIDAYIAFAESARTRLSGVSAWKITTPRHPSY